MFSIKKFQIIFLLFLITFKSVSQDNCPVLRQQLDHVFANIDKSQIPYGTLEENSFGFMNLWQLQRSGTSPTDTLQPIDATVLRAAYATLETGKINNNYSLLPIDSLNARILRYRQAQPNYNPITLVYAGYSYMDSLAVQKNLFTVQNGQLQDVMGRWQSPYLSEQLLVAAPEVGEDADGVVTFVFPQDLLFSNLPSQKGKEKPTWWVSFGNTDNAYDFQPLVFDQPYTISYPSKGMKAIRIQLRQANDKLIGSTTTVIRILEGSSTKSKIANTAQTERYELQQLREFNIPFQAFVHSGARLQIRLSQTNNVVQPTGDVRLRKPLIVLEGYDISTHNNFLYPNAKETPNYDIFSFLGVDANGQALRIGIDEPNFSLNTRWDNTDYDLIFVDYTNGTDDIVRNARMFQEVLRWVNARKVPNAVGAREQNVVLGLSMGGLVGRYGLAAMEKNRRAGQANNDHEVRLLLTHDSPHRGANVPIAMQSLVETARPLEWAVRISPGLSILLGNSLAALGNEANKQMAIYRTIPIGALAAGNILYQKNTWLDDTYRPMVTFPDNAPAPYQFIALSNGSECGTRHAAPFTELMSMTASGFFMHIPWLLKPKIKTTAVMRGLPDRQFQQIYDLNIYYTVSFFGGLIEINTSLVNARGHSRVDMLPIDGMAGGREGAGLFRANTSSYWWIIGGGYELLANRVTSYCFVPKYSALDIRPDVPIDEIVANQFHATQVPNPSRADRFFTAPHTTGGLANEFNQWHLLFTNRNAEFIFSQMEPTNANAGLPIIDCFNAICGTATQQIQSSLPSLCFGVNNVFSVSNLPTPVTVVWAADNNLVQIATPNAAITNITPTNIASQGWVTITVTVTSAVCNTFNQTISRRIWVGAVTSFTLSSRVEGCNFLVTANTAGATNFEWEIDNPNVAFGIATSPNTIAIHASEWRSLGLTNLTITCRAGNTCNAIPVSITRTFNRPNFPLCPLRVMPPSIKVYPNPTNNLLNIAVENLNSPIEQVVVRNSIGTVVLQTATLDFTAEKTTVLSLATLPEGIYFLTVSLQDGQQLSQKVVVQRSGVAN